MNYVFIFTCRFTSLMSFHHDNLGSPLHVTQEISLFKQRFFLKVSHEFYITVATVHLLFLHWK